MRATLISLKEYQDTLLRVAELDRLLSKIPPEIEALETEWQTVQTRMTTLTTRKAELEKRISSQRISLEEANAKARKYEGDLHGVTNNKEYHAVLKEIDSAKKQIHSLEEDISNRMKELTEVELNIEENTTLSATAKTAWDDALAAHKESQATNQVERKEKELLRVKLAESVPERLLRQFERIAERRNGIGLATCMAAICGACNVRVRQNIVDELRKFKKVINCESCKRILIFTEGDE